MTRRFFFAALAAAAMLYSSPARATMTTSVISVTCIASGGPLTCALPYKFFDNSDLIVTLNGVLQTIGTNYTASCAGCQSGGSVTMVSNPTAGASLVVTRYRNYLQLFNARTQGSFRPASYENAYDDLSAQIQQLAAIVTGQAGGIVASSVIANSPIIGTGIPSDHLRWDFSVANTWTALQTFTPSSGNTNAITATGHGTGSGIAATGGTGSGTAVTGVGSVGGSGGLFTGGASGFGLVGYGGAVSSGCSTATGYAGICGVGGAGGDGGRFTGGSNSAGVTTFGTGVGAGLASTGGSTGPGGTFVGGATSGAGLTATASAGNSDGVTATGHGSNPGASATGGATGHGVVGNGGASGGDGVQGYSNVANGVYGQGAGAFPGGSFFGGTTGSGVTASGGASGGNGITAQANGGNGSGASFIGNGSGSGATAKAGATGTALVLKPQASSKTASIDMYSSGGSVLWSMGKQTDDSFFMHDTTNVNDFLTVSTTGSVAISGSSTNASGSVSVSGGTGVVRAGNGGAVGLNAGYGGDFTIHGGNGGGVSIAAGSAGSCLGTCDGSPVNGGGITLTTGAQVGGGTEGKILLRTGTGPTTELTIDVGATAAVTVNGTFATSSSKNRGTCTLGTNCGTITVLSGAICVATDTTAANAVKATVAATTLTITGTGTDVIAYLCN